MAQRVFMIRREVLGHAADQPYVSVTGLPTVRAREAKLLDRELPRDDDRSLAPGRTVIIVEAERLPIVGEAGRVHERVEFDVDRGPKDVRHRVDTLETTVDRVELPIGDEIVEPDIQRHLAGIEQQIDPQI